jgi:hypothetical protein
MADLGVLIGPSNPLQAADRIAKITDGVEGSLLRLDSSNLPVWAAPTEITLKSANSRNLIINGSCRVAQRAGETVTDQDWHHCAVDRFDYALASDAAVSTVQAQITTLGIGRGRCGIELASTAVHISAAVRHRIEGKDAQELYNQYASFSCKVYHNKSSSVNYKIIISKANSLDNFAAVTQITASGLIPVSGSTATTILLESVYMGDCTNGIQIEVVALTSVTATTFYFTDFSLESGIIANTIVVPTYMEELAMCQRYYEVHGGVNGTMPMMLGYSATGNTIAMGVPFAVPKRVVPTMTKAGTWTVSNAAQPTVQCPSVAGYEILTAITTTGAGGFYPADSTCFITADAEFAV